MEKEKLTKQHYLAYLKENRSFYSEVLRDAVLRSLDGTLDLSLEEIYGDVYCTAHLLGVLGEVLVVADEAQYAEIRDFLKDSSEEDFMPIMDVLAKALPEISDEDLKKRVKALVEDKLGQAAVSEQESDPMPIEIYLRLMKLKDKALVLTVDDYVGKMGFAEYTPEILTFLAVSGNLMTEVLAFCTGDKLENGAGLRFDTLYAIYSQQKEKSGDILDMALEQVRKHPVKNWQPNISDMNVQLRVMEIIAQKQEKGEHISFLQTVSRSKDLYQQEFEMDQLYRTTKALVEYAQTIKEEAGGVYYKEFLKAVVDMWMAGASRKGGLTKELALFVMDTFLDNQEVLNFYGGLSIAAYLLQKNTADQENIGKLETFLSEAARRYKLLVNFFRGLSFKDGRYEPDWVEFFLKAYWDFHKSDMNIYSFMELGEYLAKFAIATDYFAGADFDRLSAESFEERTAKLEKEALGVLVAEVEEAFRGF